MYKLLYKSSEVADQSCAGLVCWTTTPHSYRVTAKNGIIVNINIDKEGRNDALSILSKLEVKFEFSVYIISVEAGEKMILYVQSTSVNINYLTC